MEKVREMIYPNIRQGRPRHDLVGEILSIGDRLLVDGILRTIIYLHPVIVLIPRGQFNECLIVEPELWRKSA